MKITIVCDNPNSWIIPYVNEIVKVLSSLGHNIFFIYSHNKVKSGDLAFYLSCEKIVPKKILELNNHNLVVHESDLPKGKGWSPLTWQILEGKTIIPIVLFEAVEKVDSGDIYLRDEIVIEETDLLCDIKHKQGMKTKELVLKFVEMYPNIKGIKQKGEETFYRRRTPDDSKIDLDKSINSQFNLLRVVDNERYPAFFVKNGQKYLLKIYKEY